jgi:hypothetical protein
MALEFRNRGALDEHPRAQYLCDGLTFLVADLGDDQPHYAFSF